MPIHTNQLGHLVTTKLLTDQGLSLSFHNSHTTTTDVELYAIPKPFADGIRGDSPHFINYKATKRIGNINIPIGGKEIDIILSPFPPETWENIFSVKVTPQKTHDYVGFIAEFTDILEKLKINILSLQSNPTFSEEPYSFWLLVDLSKFDSLWAIDKELSRLPIDLSTNDPYRYEIRRQKVKEQLDSLLSSIISVTELRGIQLLYNFSKKTKHTQAPYWNELISNAAELSFTVEDGIGTIPKYVINKLIGLRRGTIQYSIVSSPHQKSYFILRIFEVADIMYLDINNKDEIGSIEKISQVIKECHGNVLTGTAQIEKFNGQFCHYYVLVQSTPSESINILKGLSQLEQVPRIIVYNCSPDNRVEIRKERRNLKNVRIVPQNPIRAYLSQRSRHFAKKHDLSWSNIASQIMMTIVTSFFKLLFYGFSLALVTVLSKFLIGLGGKYFSDSRIMEGVKSWIDWM